MAPLKLQRIVTCSSQDPAFPAENLLKSGTNHRWKCKVGEQTATVIIQLEKSSVIGGIDIGNEASAFVEVLVGRESVPDDFKVILPMSSFMTPSDSRNEEQTNRVRIFRTDDLHKPECTEKWDRIQIVCTQPFNKFIKYGLAFITLHEHEPAPECSAPTQLGRFTIKDSDDDISVGSIFARRKEESEPDPKPPSAAGSWRDAAKASSSKKDYSKEKASKENATPKVKDSSSGKKNPSTDKSKKMPEKKTTDENKERPARKQDVTNEPKTVTPTQRASSKRPNQDEPSSSRKGKQIKLDSNVIYKPFSKLLEGVEIVISGYVNPGRADIRSKALEMGAKYCPDWTSTCTHLICAFANTPKFQQVKGKGKIVTRDWIDDCHRERKQLPWRRYAVDPAEQSKTNDPNEKEVWELVKDSNGTSSAVGRRNALSGEDTSSATRVDDSGADTEDEVERVKIAQTKKKIEASKKDLNGITSSPKHKREENKAAPSKSKKENSVDPEIRGFDISTDEETESDSVDNKLPKLPSIFKNKFFYLHPSLSKSQTERLERYIIAFCGTVCNILDENVHYVITEKKVDNVDDAPGVFYVRPEWIWKCNDAGRIVPICDHEL